MTGMPEDYKLRLSADALSVLLDCAAPEGQPEALIARICHDLAELDIDPEFGLPAPPVLTGIVRAAREKQGLQLRDVVLMQGLAPGRSSEGSLDWTGDYFTRGFRMDGATEQVNFREQDSDPSIEEGEHVVTVTRSVLGTPGKNLKGSPVAACAPPRFEFKSGPGIRLEAEEEGEPEKYYAEFSGRLRWKRRELAVDRVHSVRGNVNMASGNIRHPGAVVISGDVEPGGNVQAAGSVEIKGLLDSGTVQTGGDLLVRSALIGRKGTQIQAEGGVSAQSIRSADIEAGGDVVVEREVVASNLQIGGSFSLHKGRVVGGSVLATTGIVVAQVGSPAEVATTLELQTPITDSDDPEQKPRMSVIVVLDRAFCGTTLVVGKRQLYLDEEIRGPVQTAVVDGKLVLLPVRPSEARKG